MLTLKRQFLFILQYRKIVPHYALNEQNESNDHEPPQFYGMIQLLCWFIIYRGKQSHLCYLVSKHAFCYKLNLTQNINKVLCMSTLCVQGGNDVHVTCINY